MKNTIILLISIATFIACAKQKAEQVSTIDSTLQVSVDSILQNKLSELDAAIGQVIVMEVQTGDIKASVGTDSILQESGLVRTASLLAAWAAMDEPAGGRKEQKRRRAAAGGREKDQ